MGKERLKDSAGVTESPSVANKEQNRSKLENKKGSTNECSIKQLNEVDKKNEHTSEVIAEQGPSKIESKQEPPNEEDSKHWSEMDNTTQKTEPSTEIDAKQEPKTEMKNEPTDDCIEDEIVEIRENNNKNPETKPLISELKAEEETLQSPSEQKD